MKDIDISVEFLHSQHRQIELNIMCKGVASGTILSEFLGWKFSISLKTCVLHEKCLNMICFGSDLAHLFLHIFMIDCMQSFFFCMG